MSTQQQTCKICGRLDKFDFNLPDDIWGMVVGTDLKNKVVCLSCFDDLASIKGIKYAGFLPVLYFAGSQATIVFQAVSSMDSQSSGKEL